MPRQAYLCISFCPGKAILEPYNDLHRRTSSFATSQAAKRKSIMHVCESLSSERRQTARYLLFSGTASLLHSRCQLWGWLGLSRVEVLFQQAYLCLVGLPPRPVCKSRWFRAWPVCQETVTVSGHGLPWRCCQMLRLQLILC